MSENPKFILASGSPRRHELLWNLGLEFRLHIPDVHEDFPADLPVRMVPAFLSEKKAQACTDYLRFDEILIAADTSVIHNNRLFGKPAEEEEAIWMLQELSGSMHEVITGVTLKSRSRQTTFSELTRVYFRKLSAGQIRNYVSACKPFDKAGGYGIQEWIGYVGIERINGCFYNVMGLPVSRLVRELDRFGVEVPVRRA